ncbi:MAG: lipid-A-disaccharide synthase [Parachlamydiaceae bacterium]|nr:lipid-A-disaccharide synthase [Parachlamydiaceae bacterium]
MTHFFCFAGELSGDMHGARLLNALKRHVQPFVVTGVGGPEMRAQGITGTLNMEDFEVMGFSDVLWALPRLRRQFYQIRDYILQTVPEVAIFIDSPSFSLRMARALRKKGYQGKIVQYISPTVWAWGKHRIQEMAETLNLLLTIYPFEESYFTDTSLRVQYVGNPLLENLTHHRYDSDWQKFFGIKQVNNIVALFPGSRTAEIERNLPKQIEAAEMLHKESPDTVFAISCAHENHMRLFKNILQKSNLRHNKEVFFVPRLYSYDLMRSCRSAIAKSGTVTLELALHHCPTVVVYEVTWLNRLIAKYVMRLKLPYYCIVNILAGKQVYPELIEKGFSAKNLYQHVAALHREGEERTNCVENCKQVSNLFKEKNSSERAAQAILELLI